MTNFETNLVDLASPNQMMHMLEYLLASEDELDQDLGIELLGIVCTRCAKYTVLYRTHAGG